MHYHGYVYRPRGHGEPPSDFDERYRAPWGEFWSSSPWTPNIVCHWLMKPVSFVKNTSDTPEEAVTWAASLYRPLWSTPDAHRAQHGTDVDQRLVSLRDELARGGEDVLCGPIGYDYSEIWILSCPNRVYPHPPCPLGRKDTRPEGFSRLTGIPLAPRH